MESEGLYTLRPGSDHLVTFAHPNEKVVPLGSSFPQLPQPSTTTMTLPPHSPPPLPLSTMLPTKHIGAQTMTDVICVSGNVPSMFFFN